MSKFMVTLKRYVKVFRTPHAFCLVYLLLFVGLLGNLLHEERGKAVLAGRIRRRTYEKYGQRHVMNSVHSIFGVKLVNAWFMKKSFQNA